HSLIDGPYREEFTLELGYSLSSEEHSANDLVRFAQRAEQAGFSFALISDHYHPWTSKQGQSPFVWSVIGAIAATTKKLRLGTAVTAATAATMMPGRFFLGVGTGENRTQCLTRIRSPRSASSIKSGKTSLNYVKRR